MLAAFVKIDEKKISAPRLVGGKVALGGIWCQASEKINIFVTKKVNGAYTWSTIGKLLSLT